MSYAPSQWLEGRVAAVADEGPLRDGIVAALERSGARVASTLPEVLHVFVPIITAPAVGSLRALSITDYEQASEAMMWAPYRLMREAALRIRASGGGAIVQVACVGDKPSHLVQGLANGLQSITACFGASFGSPPNTVRVNAIQTGDVSGVADVAAVAEAVAAFASDQTSYMNGMTTHLLGDVRPRQRG